VNLKPAAVTRFLAVVVTSLAALSIAGQFAYYVLGLKGTIAKKLFALFYADWEYNLRSWYSASALLACALLLVLIAATRRRRGDRFALHWSALALLFFGLSLDEAIGLHERLNDFVGRPAMSTCLPSTGSTRLTAIQPTHSFFGFASLPVVSTNGQMPA